MFHCSHFFFSFERAKMSLANNGHTTRGRCILSFLVFFFLLDCNGLHLYQHNYRLTWKGIILLQQCMTLVCWAHSAWEPSSTLFNTQTRQFHFYFFKWKEKKHIFDIVLIHESNRLGITVKILLLLLLIDWHGMKALGNAEGAKIHR